MCSKETTNFDLGDLVPSQKHSVLVATERSVSKVTKIKLNYIADVCRFLEL